MVAQVLSLRSHEDWDSLLMMAARPFSAGSRSWGMRWDRWKAAATQTARSMVGSQWARGMIWWRYPLASSSYMSMTGETCVETVDRESQRLM